MRVLVLGKGSSPFVGHTGADVWTAKTSKSLLALARGLWSEIKEQLYGEDC